VCTCLSCGSSLSQFRVRTEAATIFANLRITCRRGRSHQNLLAATSPYTVLHTLQLKTAMTWSPYSWLLQIYSNLLFFMSGCQICKRYLDPREPHKKAQKYERNLGMGFPWWSKNTGNHGLVSEISAAIFLSKRILGLNFTLVTSLC
jgi:hypothetical protein